MRALILSLGLAGLCLGSPGFPGSPALAGPSRAPEGLIYEVNKIGDSGSGSCLPDQCTLRDAILEANATPGHDTIVFKLPAIGSRRITVSPQLPTITEPLTIDGTSLPDFESNRVILDGIFAGAGAVGLDITAGDTTIKALAIEGFDASGIQIRVKGGNVVESSFIGTSVNGNLARPNAGDGILILDTANNRIGGTTRPEIFCWAPCNTLSANGHHGIEIRGPGAHHNLVVGNYIGTDAAGLNPLANTQDGIFLSDGAHDNTIGSVDHGDKICDKGCNLISGNGFHGIEITGQAATANAILGNFIGTHITDTKRISNTQSGIFLNQTPRNRVGGPEAGAGNVISGNGNFGITIQGGTAVENVVSGNLIGTSRTGETGLGNGLDGVKVQEAARNQIGGPTAADRNVIAANGQAGVHLLGGTTTGNLIQGNYIGTDITGAVVDPDDTKNTGDELGNRMIGVLIEDGPRNWIGGASRNLGNVISGSGLNGVHIQGQTARENQVLANRIGTSANGQSAIPNGQNGVHLAEAPATEVGGTAGITAGACTGACNVIAANGGSGVFVSGAAASRTNVEGNFIGLRADGQRAMGNGQQGVVILGGATYTDVGTNAPNVISGNDGNGVALVGATTVGNLIQGNFIGTDPTGAETDPDGRPASGDEFGNLRNGVAINAVQTLVGGTGVPQRNIISGNQDGGVYIFGADGNHNQVQGNYIGTDVTGLLARPNRLNGVQIDDAASNAIGGTVAGAANVISGNGANGVQIQGEAAKANTVQGNFIGVDKTGSGALGNAAGAQVGTGNGVVIADAGDNQVGGRTDLSRNVISANFSNGVLIQGTARGTAGSVVEGNLIGVDVSGTQPLGNQLDGVQVWTAGVGHTIGGPMPGAGNVIAANGRNGVVLSSTSGNWVQGNSIGTDRTGMLELGNAENGVHMQSDASDNVIGETAIGSPTGGDATNTIAFNGGRGVVVVAGAGNAIRRNRIQANGSMGIDLFPVDLTPNDPLDPDSGANELQNFPVLTLVNRERARGRLESRPLATYRLEFFGNKACDGSGYGEGEAFLATAEVTTDADGKATFDVALTSAALAWSFVTATATDKDGNTSEFAACLGPSGPPTPQTATATPTRTPTRPSSGTPDRRRSVHLPLVLDRIALVAATPGGPPVIASPPTNPSQVPPTSVRPTASATQGPGPSPTRATPATPGPTPRTPGTTPTNVPTVRPTVPATPTTSTPDDFATAVAATLTALAPSPTSGTTIPPETLTPTTLPTSIPSATPIPSPTPTVLPVTLDEIATTSQDAPQRRMAFVGGDVIIEWVKVTNHTAAQRRVALRTDVIAHTGLTLDTLTYDGPIDVAPGAWWFPIQRTMPANAPVTAYTFQATIEGSQSRSAELVVARSLQLAEDFGNPASGWASGSGTSSTYGYRNGLYRVTVSAPTWGQRIRAPGTAGTGETILEADVSVTSTLGGRAGLAFGDQDVDNFSIFEIDRDGRYLVGMYAGGSWQIFANRVASAWLTTDGQPNHLLLVYRQGSLDVYANGQQLTTIHDVIAPAGSVGLYAESDASPMEALFDNFRAYRP